MTNGIGSHTDETAAAGHAPGKPGNVTHGQEHTTQAGDGTGQDQRDNPDFVGILTNGFGGGLILSNSTHLQAEGGAVDEKIQHNDQQEANIG